MTDTALSAVVENRLDGGNATDFDPGQAMPEALKQACQENPHLLEYLNRLPISRIGMPEYLPELSRRAAERKEPNLIYPVGRNGMFVHILYDEKGDRHNYIPIEPTTSVDLGSLMARWKTPA